ncbi:MAG: hypothetical protein WC459_00435 [Patescibacteria group bacterium]
MLKKHPVLSSILSSLLLLGYVSAVSWFMNNAERFFGNKPDSSGAILILLLLVFSALISGLLVLGGPIYLYLENEKKPAFKLLAYNVIFLAIILLIVGIILTL